MDRSVESVARHAAAQLVSTAMVQPILAELRANSSAAAPFARGDAERQFGPMLDAIIADRMTLASDWPLVDAIARRLTGDTDHRAKGGALYG